MTPNDPRCRPHRLICGGRIFIGLNISTYVPWYKGEAEAWIWIWKKTLIPLTNGCFFISLDSHPHKTSRHKWKAMSWAHYKPRWDEGSTNYSHKILFEHICFDTSPSPLPIMPFACDGKKLNRWEGNRRIILLWDTGGTTQKQQMIAQTPCSDNSSRKSRSNNAVIHVE